MYDTIVFIYVVIKLKYLDIVYYSQYTQKWDNASTQACWNYFLVNIYWISSKIPVPFRKI